MQNNTQIDEHCTNHKCISSQYQDLVDATNIVSKTDTYGVITFANSLFEEISGYTQEELIGKSHNIVRDPDMPSSVFKELWTTLKSKKSWKGVVTNKRKDGTKYTVDASIFPILDDNENIVEYIAIRHDITELLRLSEKVKILHDYNMEQENIAREKLEAGIINHMTSEECQVVYHPSDILSGDFYSIYKLNNGSTFIYLLDGQGHGVAPSLTVFAISSIMNQIINEVETIEELVIKLAPNIKNFLGDIEQLSYTMIIISADKKELFYASGGMYPFLIKKGDDVMKFKANNTPFMNFSNMPVVTNVQLGEWDSIMVYTDGLVEHEKDKIEHLKPEALISESFKNMQINMRDIYNYKFDDDVTCLYFQNS